MHAIRKSEDGLWTVGFWEYTRCDWNPIRDFNDEREALEMVSFLNGGEMPRWWRVP
jgi:hypothetical protein